MLGRGANAVGTLVADPVVAAVTKTASPIRSELLLPMRRVCVFAIEDPTALGVRVIAEFLVPGWPVAFVLGSPTFRLGAGGRLLRAARESLRPVPCLVEHGVLASVVSHVVQSPKIAGVTQLENHCEGGGRAPMGILMKQYDGGNHVCLKRVY